LKAELLALIVREDLDVRDVEDGLAKGALIDDGPVDGGGLGLAVLVNGHLGGLRRHEISWGMKLVAVKPKAGLNR
jgi:hypothetical protein